MSKIIRFWKKTDGRPLPSNVEFEKLLSPHINPLYQLAYHWCGNQHDAEDLLQNLLYKLYLQKQTLSTIDQLRPWLVRVLYRLFVDQYRQNARSLRNVSDDHNGVDQFDDPVLRIPASEDHQPERIFESNLFIDRLAAAVLRLPEQQRVLLVMHDIENYQLDEISRILEIPLGTVKSRLHRARERLRNILAASGTFSPVDPC